MTAAGCLERERELQREAEKTGQEFLWFWELESMVVVVGRSGDLENEVHLRACQLDTVPVLRRDSGGGAVLLGPGCLSYSLILSVDYRPQLRDIEYSYSTILGAVGRATGISNISCEHGDLILSQRKFGGSSQRRMKRTVLHHGTVLHRFSLASIERYIREPRRQPAHRRQRPHAEFLTNISLDSDFAKRLHCEFPEACRIS